MDFSLVSALPLLARTPKVLDLFLRDLRTAVDWLDGLTGPMPHEARPSGFHH